MVPTPIKPLFDLTGKTVVLTGAAGILGTHFAHGYAEFGATLALVDMDGEAVSALAEDVAAQHGTATHPFPVDIATPDAVAQFYADLETEVGPADVLHNNAASKGSDLNAFFAGTEDYNLAMWREIAAVNLDGAFLMAQGAIRQMKASGRGGSIIQTASIYGIMGPDDRIYAGSRYLDRQISLPAVYSATKGGIVALTRHLACQFAKDGIRVNTLSPGGVASGQNDTFTKNYSNRVPMGRMANAHELVGAAIYLASNASSYVTGQNLVVDGGLQAW